MSRLRRAFTSISNVVLLGSGVGGDVQGLMNASLKVHAIEQDQKQSTAMMVCRTYFYLPTWEDRLQQAGSGHTRTIRGGGGEAGGENC